jgi:hypothetical protein
MARPNNTPGETTRPPATGNSFWNIRTLVPHPTYGEVSAKLNPSPIEAATAPEAFNMWLATQPNGVAEPREYRVVQVGAIQIFDLTQQVQVVGQQITQLPPA